MLTARFSCATNSFMAASSCANTGNAADAYADPPESRRQARGLALEFALRDPTDHLSLHAAQRWDRCRWLTPIFLIPRFWRFGWRSTSTK